MRFAIIAHLADFLTRLFVGCNFEQAANVVVIHTYNIIEVAEIGGGNLPRDAGDVDSAFGGVVAHPRVGFLT
ncbi:MAG: hypothetical protein II655_02700 [Thermoguttaceae bacterium]|nr:hypothetical protein [Thermoguttaceae bacterium]